MNKDIIQSNQWLMETLGTSEVPAYEVDKRALSLLQQVQQQVQANDESARQLTARLRAARAGYAAEQRRLEAAQRHLGLEPAHLSTGAQRVLWSLGVSAQLLGLAEPCVAGFLLEYTRLLRSAAEVDARLEREQATLQAQGASVKQLLVAEAALERQLAEAAVQRGADTAVAKQKLAKSRFLTDKVHEYRRLVRRNEATLAERGFSEEMTHGMVLRRHELLLQKCASLQQLQQKLDRFGQLPPDPDLARVKIAEMEDQLEKLESNFNDKIHGMHM